MYAVLGFRLFAAGLKSTAEEVVLIFHGFTFDSILM